MKYQNNNHKAEMMGNIQSIGGFSIKADGKVFQSLTSNLYGNQIGAILRELACNAADAHNEADKLHGTNQKDVPFDVHLPTELEPFFFIRDYGTGLSHEDIKNVYSVIFESTKDDSNDATGCFGLGSKTPLSYNTKSFIVYSYQNGKERSYTAFFQENGIPDIAFQDEKKTNEVDGLKVYVTCRKDDIPSWHENAKIFLSFHKSPAANVLNPSFEFKNEQVFLESSNWKIFEESSQRDNYILMGNVPYPISIPNILNSGDEVGLYEYKRELTDVLNNLESKGFVLELQVPIGDVTPQLSREELYYDVATCKNILKACATFKEELISMIKNRLNELQNYDSYFEACMEYTNLSERKFSFLSNEGFSNPQWNGDIPDLYKSACNGWLIRTVMSLDPLGIEYTMYASHYSRGGKYVVKAKKDVVLDLKNMFKEGTIFVVGKGRGYKSKCRYWVKENSAYIVGSAHAKIILFEEEDFNLLKEVIGIKDSMMNKCSPKYNEALGYKFNKLNYFDIDEMEKPSRSSYRAGYIPKEGRVTKDSLRANVICHMEDGKRVQSYGDFGEDVIVYGDDEATVVYCSLQRGSRQYVDNSFLEEYRKKYLNLDLNDINVFDCSVYDHIKVIDIKGKTDSASFKKAKRFGWIPVEEYVQEWLAVNEDKILAITEYNYAKNLKKVCSEVAELHPKIAEYDEKRDELIDNIKKVMEELEVSPSRSVSMPVFKKLEDLSIIKEIKELEKMSENPTLEELVNCYNYSSYSSRRMFKRFWDALKFHVKWAYDDELNPINVESVLSEIKVASEKTEKTEETEETEECA